MHKLWRSHFGADEHPFATNFDVHQGYRVVLLPLFSTIILFQKPASSFFWVVRWFSEKKDPLKEWGSVP